MFGGWSDTRKTFLVVLLGCLLILVAYFLPACEGPPEARFEASVSSGQAPLKVSFSNKSKNADQFHWDFGDGNDTVTSKAGESVDHQYTVAGMHTVKLTVFKEEEPAKTSVMNLNIIVKPGPLDRVKLNPETTRLAVGQIQQLTAEAVDAYDNSISEVQLTWEVVAGAGTITSDGILTAGTKAGSFDSGITVTGQMNSHSVKATGLLILDPGPLDHVTLNPETVQLTVNQNRRLTAEAQDVYGNRIPEAQLTWKVTGGAGTITSDGRLTASTKAGRFSNGITVTAKLNSDSAVSTVSVTVKPGPLHRVKLSPEKAELQYGQNRQFTAEAVDTYDNRIPEAQLTWKVAGGAGTITSDGIFTAGTQAGTFNAAIVVTAESNGHSVSETATVTIGEWFMTYLGMNTEVLPYSDRRIRQAVSFCIDGDELTVWVRDTYISNAQKVLSIVSPTESKANISPYRNIEMARYLMAEAGYPNGFLATPLYVSSGLEWLAEKIAAYLADADINTDIISVDDPDLSNLQKLRTRWGSYWGYLFLTDTSVDWDNTPELLGRLLHSTGDENFTGYSNENFDSLFNADSFSEAEDLYFDGFEAIVPLYWNMPSATPQSPPS